MVNWGSVYYAANLLLAQNTQLTTYQLQTEYFMNQWMCNTKVILGSLTPSAILVLYICPGQAE